MLHKKTGPEFAIARVNVCQGLIGGTLGYWGLELFLYIFLVQVALAQDVDILSDMIEDSTICNFTLCTCLKSIVYLILFLCHYHKENPGPEHSTASNINGT